MLDTKSGPAKYLRAVTPSDTVDIATITDGNLKLTPRALYVGSTGDLSVLAEGDSSPVLISAAVSGTVLPIRATRVYDTNTTASSIVALY